MSPQLHATDADAGERLDVFVAKTTSVSRAQAGSLVDDGLVNVNGAVQRKAYRVSSGDLVEVAEREHVAHAPPEGVEVIFSDDDLMVVSKPSGVVVHAAAGVRTGTLVDALVAAGHQLSTRGGDDRPGIVHRLDRDVSGLLDRRQDATTRTNGSSTR